MGLHLDRILTLQANYDAGASSFVPLNIIAREKKKESVIVNCPIFHKRQAIIHSLIVYYFSQNTIRVSVFTSLFINPFDSTQIRKKTDTRHA